MISEHQVDLIIAQLRMRALRRRRGRPHGSRAIDKNQGDLFPVEKLREQVRLQKKRAA